MWKPESRLSGTSESSRVMVSRRNASRSSTGTTRLNAPPSRASSISLLCAPRVVRNACFCAHGTFGRSFSSVSHTPGSGFFSSSFSSAAATTPAMTRAISARDILCCLIY